MGGVFEVRKTMEIAGAHALKLDYASKCTQLHGHNWIVTVVCRAREEELGADGMVVDFSKIKEVVQQLDHRCLNEIVPQPTAELIARYLCEAIPRCVRVEVQESGGNVAVYEKATD